MSAAPRTEHVVLVDERGETVGSAEKLAAHVSPGLLHLAFSVFVFDSRGRLLLQQRAATKYHFAGRWSNTCCGHPRPGETPLDGGARRLTEEMGIAVSLTDVGTFRYQAADPASSLAEHELDHVLVGFDDGEPEPDPAEVSSWRWVAVDALRSELAGQPDRYTPWLPEALTLAARPA